MALFVCGVQVEVREVLLRDKPASMLELSPKGTVPVLQLADGTVIDESLDIMLWALKQNDTKGWLKNKEQALILIAENDTSFKKALDRYKYPHRYQDEPQMDWRAEAEKFIAKLENNLQKNNFLLSDKPTLADYAIFPFIRQFRMPNSDWFDNIAPYPHVRNWLAILVKSPEFTGVMDKYPPYTVGVDTVYLLQNS